MHNVRRLTAEGIAAYRDWLKKGATGPAAFSKGSDASVRSWVRVRAPQFPSEESHAQIRRFNHHIRGSEHARAGSDSVGEKQLESEYKRHR
jgi:hypothetical protein